MTGGAPGVACDEPTAALLERIAVALEKIAGALPSTGALPSSTSVAGVVIEAAPIPELDALVAERGQQMADAGDPVRSLLWLRDTVAKDCRDPVKRKLLNQARDERAVRKTATAEAQRLALERAEQTRAENERAKEALLTESRAAVAKRAEANRARVVVEKPKALPLDDDKRRGVVEELARLARAPYHPIVNPGGANPDEFGGSDFT